MYPVMRYRVASTARERHPDGSTCATVCARIKCGHFPMSRDYLKPAARP